MRNKKISVLLSVYHGDDPSDLNVAIKSSLNQTLPPAEIVLVIDGPVGESLQKIIEKWRLARPELFNIIFLPVNAGLGNALKAGLKACSHEIVARMDSDDISEPDRFKLQYDFLVNNSEVDVVGGYISEFINVPEQQFALRKVPIEHTRIMRLARYRNPVNHVTVMFRKEAALRSGGYEPFLFQEDYFLWVRMMMNGSVFANIPRVLVRVRVGEAMFGRRRGWKYLLAELKLHLWFYKKRFIGAFGFLRNCLIRILVRLMPRFLVEISYVLIRKL